MSGRIYGNAGASLNGAGKTFAANDTVAKFGAAGEQKTGRILAEVAQAGPTVLHDLRMPVKKFSANIDHVIVSGNTVTLIDTKAWAGGFYWTLAGATYRGLTRFSARDRSGKTVYPAEKKTLPMARDMIAGYLGIPAHQVKLGLIIWPVGKKPLNTMFFRSPGSPTVFNGETLRAGNLLSRYGKKPANPGIVSKLAQLV